MTFPKTCNHQILIMHGFRDFIDWYSLRAAPFASAGLLRRIFRVRYKLSIESKRRKWANMMLGLVMFFIYFFTSCVSDGLRVVDFLDFNRNQSDFLYSNLESLLCITISFLLIAMTASRIEAGYEASCSVFYLNIEKNATSVNLPAIYCYASDFAFLSTCQFKLQCPG